LENPNLTSLSKVDAAKFPVQTQVTMSNWREDISAHEIRGFRSGFTMFWILGFAIMGILLVAGLTTGCKPKLSEGLPASPGYFQTPFQNESQFVVEAIVSDLAEQMFFAANHRLPDSQYFSVIAQEKPNSPKDAPVYELQIRLDPKQAELKCELVINGPIWSPAVYQGVVTQIAQAVGLKASNLDESEDTALLSKLTDGTAETIEREDQRLSAALESDFNNPKLHEQAALLLGAFLLRDHSGSFYEIRTPFCRLTSHLIMAQFLRGTSSATINGNMAEAIMLTLSGDEALALQRLNAIGTNNAIGLPMVRSLRALNTGDYRPLDNTVGLSPIECVAWFSAYSGYVSSTLAWPKLSDDQKQTIDFVRAANQEGFSVEMGHQLLDVSVPLELQEISSIYALSHSEKLTKDGLINALNELPGRCFAHTSDKAHVSIIGWGQWAEFLQRHLCHAVQENFYFMNTMWGVPDDAKQFAAKCEEQFGGLRLYPFVRRFNCTNVDAYHKSVDDGFKVTVATPQFVPAVCWNYLCYKVNFAPFYNPNPNPHVSEWHNHNPLPGTVYDLTPRMDHRSLVGRADTVARFERLHELAPYDCRIMNYLLNNQFKATPSYDQATNLFQTVLPYSTFAMRTVANIVYNQPELYQNLMLQAAALDPASYYVLGDYEIDRQEEDLAAKYIDQACEADQDSVRVSNHAVWRVKYYLKKGQIEKARQIADAGAEVYSATGLAAKGVFLEQTTNYDDAFEWFSKIEERYDDSGPLISFCERYKALTGDTRFEPAVKQRQQKVFPKGIENVTLTSFKGAPVDGVLIRQQSDLLTAANLKAGDVIVALNGIHTHTFAQYLYVRDSLDSPELDLIVWQGTGYHEIKASPPKHLFGADFGDYWAQ
jgi:tetratricopeptide (TPR) repeat protein